MGDRGRKAPGEQFQLVAGGGLVFDARALEALGDLLEGRGELLPLDVQDDEEEYRLFNVTRVSDALDEDQSELKRFSSDGRIMRVVRFAFDADRLAGETIFKLVQRPNYNYVTEVFRERAEAAALTGFRWREPVWQAAPVSGVTR